MKLKPQVPVLALTLAACAALRAAQPDYTNAIWNAAYPGHWYTNGNTHAFVVIHDMEGYYLSSISYFQQSNTSASIHYCVNGLKDNASDAPAGEITQMVEEKYWAWHVLCWNRYMFGIEHEGFVSNPAWYTEEQYQASGALTRYLCNKYSIPKDRNHIIGHDQKRISSWLTWMTNNWPAIDPTCNTHTDPGLLWDWNHYMAIVSGLPAITTQPWSRAADRGASVAFNVTATGTAPLAYQWRKNGTNIAGATTSSYSLANIQLPDAAGYTVLITNSFGAITSRVATLSVNPVWLTAFADDFETNSAANWNLFWGVGSGGSDFTTNWAFDYSATAYVANGVTNFIPSAPNSGGATRGLKITVNKNDAVAALAGVSLDPKNLSFSNDYTLRFDAWINYVGGAGGGVGSTEYFTCGLNHTGTRVNWLTTNATASDGLWFAVDGDAGSGASDYRAFQGNGASPPTVMTFATGGLAASGAASDNAADAFYRSLFPSPIYESAGAPGKHWVQVELSQIGGVITWQLNGVLVAQRANTSAYTNGDVMIGYFDPYSSIPNPPTENYLLVDNLRVLIAAIAPTIDTPPQSQSVKAGSNVTFTVTASGLPPPNYQWRFNSATIAGATNNSYLRPNVTTNDSGNYSVVVTNLAGSLTSANALLTVTPLAPLVLTNTALLAGNQLRFFISGEPGVNVTIWRSDDLTHWIFVTNVANPTGTIEFTEAIATDTLQRFYQARLAP